ncbi:hypothetical protein IJJ12_01440, partial [bacterium]|nr:hypothetical protein [bacterium]
MSKSKSQKFYELLKENQPARYSEFKKIHEAFAADPEANRDEFNRIGQDFVQLVRSYERRLCGGMERTKNAFYSTGVSETYWKLVREDFPLIDQVGVTVG